MITPVPPKVAHADQVPTFGTAVETERGRLVALGVRRRGVELESAGSRVGWEAAQAAQVTPVGGKPRSGCRVVLATPSIGQALRWPFWEVPDSLDVP